MAFCHNSEGKWVHLVPGAIPARCLKIHRQAFFSKVCTGSEKGKQRTTRQDRIACAAKFQKHMEEAVKNPGGR